MSEFFKDPTTGDELKVALEGDDIPEPFRGKDLKESLSEAAQRVAEATELKKQLDAQAAELEKLKKGAAPTPPAARDPKEIAEELKQQLENDPQAAIHGLLDERLKPLIEDQVKLNVDTLITLARQDATNYPDFGKYEEAVRKNLEGMPLQYRSKPEVFKTAFDLARLKDLDAIAASIKAGTYTPPAPAAPSPFVEGASGGGLPPSPPPPSRRPTTGEVELSEDEKAFAAHFGMTPEEYKRWGKDDAIGGVPLMEEKVKRQKELERVAALRR